MRRLATFDCFDTVMTRATGARGLNYVLAERLRRDGVVDVAPERFVRMCSEAEELAFQRHGERRSLDHTAVQLAELLGLPAADAPRLRAAEEAVELGLIRAVPTQVESVRRARADGSRIGFISDTALSSSVVRGMLRAVGAYEEGDLLWVSNELGAGKAQGRAFLAVARDLGAAPGRWHHTGDDARADVLMARLSGVRATLDTSARLTADERLLDAAGPDTGGLSCLLAGAARRARSSLRPRDGHLPPDDRVTLPPARVAVLTGIVAPVLVGVLLWALGRAQREGAPRVVLSGPGSAAVAAIAPALLRARAEAGWRDPRVVTAGPGDAASPGDLRLEPVVRPRSASARRRDDRPPVLYLAQHTAGDDAGGDEGYLTDAAAGTGVFGEQAVLADVAAALISGADGSTEQHVLEVFAEELATTLLLLPGPADLRSALRRVLHRFWSSPGRDEAVEWGPGLPRELAPEWRAARLAAHPAPVRTLLRSGAGLRVVRAKTARGAQILQDRRATARSTATRDRAPRPPEPLGSSPGTG